MKAVEISQYGPPDVLRLVERPDPQPAPGELVIAVAAAGVNRPDVIQRYGKYPVPPGASDLPGLEVAGLVAALGEDVCGWEIGDPVCALLAGGGYAERVAVPQVQCLPIPNGLTAIEAAGIPETFFTVWTNVFERGRLQAGETILIHGGTSGIGTTAIQLAKAFGATVLATAGSDDKCAFMRGLGAAEKGAIAKAVFTHVWPLLERGTVKPIIHTTFPLAQAAEAHRLMESSTHLGKIILVC